MKKTAALSIVALSLSSPVIAGDISVEGNIGVTTDYIWRGMTQNDSDASVSGGIDVDFSNGAYIGTWIANVDYNGSSQELDVYGGYGFTRGAVSYDIGVIGYFYPDAPNSFKGTIQDLDFSEIYLTVGYGAWSASWYTLLNADGKDKGDDHYVSLDYSTDLTQGWMFNAHYGLYDVKGKKDTGADMSLGVSKDGFHFDIIATQDVGTPDSKDDKTRAVVSYSMTF